MEIENWVGGTPARQDRDCGGLTCAALPSKTRGACPQVPVGLEIIIGWGKSFKVQEACGHLPPTIIKVFVGRNPRGFDNYFHKNP